VTLTGQGGASAGDAARPYRCYPAQRSPAQQPSAYDDLDRVSPAFLLFGFGAALLALCFASLFWLLGGGQQ
jgi:hypothetical protein